jgi:signal transduction histidine kinase
VEQLAPRVHGRERRLGATTAMQSRNSPDQAASYELDRVECAFAELGLLPGESSRQRARAEAQSRPAEAPTALARGLFTTASLLATQDPSLIARLVDRLAEELPQTRAVIARELLVDSESTIASAGTQTKTLLALVEGGDRRLTRLGFDLHDGPLQELLLLGEDLRMFRGQLESVLGEDQRGRLLCGRLDDLDSRLVELERGLRGISTAVHASFLVEGPFAEAVHELADAFLARTGVAPALRVDGDPDGMSPSQRIALLSVVGEALNNVREHGQGATAVEVEVAIGAEGVTARVCDDGCGFDVEAALLEAAQRGRIGLAGIHERVRLLGGECVVESRAGGPTAVSLRLPRWEPSMRKIASGGHG